QLRPQSVGWREPAISSRTQPVGNRLHQRLPIDRLIEGLAHEADAGAVPRLLELHPMLDLQVPQGAARRVENLVAAALPAPTELDGGVEVNAGREQHIDRTGQNIRNHRVRVAQEADEHSVEPRPTQEIVVEPGELHRRARLPAEQSKWSQPNELGRES